MRPSASERRTPTMKTRFTHMAVMTGIGAVAFVLAACNATSDRLDVPPPSITPELVNVTPSPTRTPVPTPTPNPTATPTATAARSPSNPTPSPAARQTPTALPTATPTRTPTPTPTPPPNLDLEVLTFIFDLGLDPRNTEFTQVGTMTWQDLSLGCGPQDGNVPAVEVHGYIFHVTAADRDFVFHVAEHGDEAIVIDCTTAPAVSAKTLNPTKAFGLESATSAFFSRTDGEGGYDLLRVINDPADLAPWIRAFDFDFPIGNSANCETAFRVEFKLPGRSEILSFFCPDDWYRIGGRQSAWEGTQGAMPRAILDLISPILAAQPLPQVPEIEPSDELLPTQTPTPAPTATPTPAPRNTVNPTQAFNLGSALSITFSRVDANGKFQPVRKIEGSAGNEWSNALDTEITVGISETCETAFRMEFQLADGVQVIDFFCDRDWFRIGGDQPEWGGTQGTMPRAILDLIAPILAAQPLPSIPTETPEDDTTPTPVA